MFLFLTTYILKFVFPPKTADCRLPTANCQLPTVNCQLPTADCRLPTEDCRLPTAYLPASSFKNSGKNTKIAISENTNPPMAPAAKANQNASFFPATNGINPSTVELIVSIAGIILLLNALTYVLSKPRWLLLFLKLLKSFRM